MTTTAIWLRGQCAAAPVVFVARPPSGIAADCVLVDDFAGTKEATERLIERGHTRIGFVGLPSTVWTGAERFRGFRAAMTEAGLRSYKRYVRYQESDVSAAEQTVRSLLAMPTPPTALFAANNRNMFGALRAATDTGPPIALAGFDDFELAGILALPLIVVAYDAGRARAGGRPPAPGPGGGQRGRNATSARDNPHFGRRVRPGRREIHALRAGKRGAGSGWIVKGLCGGANLAQVSYSGSLSTPAALEGYGLHLEAIENVPNHFYENAMLGRAGRDEDIENVAATITNIGKRRDTRPRVPLDAHLRLAYRAGTGRPGRGHRVGL